jgi:hypothetical protein
MKNELENICAGLFLALLTAMPRDAADRAVETLFAFVADSRTGDYEAKFYRDLVECIEELSGPQPDRMALDFDCLVTLH